MKHTLVCIATFVLLTHSAWAQTYIGISGGATRYSADCDSAVRCDKSDMGLKLYGGYKFTPHLALEGGYASLGSFKTSTNNTVLGREISTSLRSSAFSLGGAFFYEFVPHFTAMGRLGLASGKIKVSSEAGSDSETKINPYAGVGVGYSLTPSLSLNGTLDMNRFKYRGDSQNIFMLGAGITYGF
jgi:OmpA-OmpF porin, OOP family